ncbi:MAG: 50S ribosomal protein L24 [Candidatus Micrarchaeaceae archaeon]|jgi:large subunit ribosomal protein L24
MIASGKPRKQRRFRFNAPMHVRQHFVHSHIDKSLKTKLNIKTRSTQISKGDTVKIMSGSKKGTSGKVTRVNLRTGRVYIDGLVKKNSRGKEFSLSVNASNVYITDLNLTDKVRAAKLKVAQQKVTTQTMKNANPEKKEELAVLEKSTK